MQPHSMNFRVHSNSSEAIPNIPSNSHQMFQDHMNVNNVNSMIRLIKNDEEINNFSSNLDFHINTLVPTNSPNIQLQKEVYLFDIVKEKEEVSCEKQSKNVKNILISHIQNLKKNASKLQTPDYLSKLINRPSLIESIAPKQLETQYKSLETHTINQNFMRTQEEPKKLEIKQKINKWTEHFKKQSETDCEIQFQNEIRNNLNKLTPDNYEILKDIILDKIKNSEKKCNFLAQKIIEKAWNEQKYTKVYAKLCHFLQNAKELDEKNLCSSSKKRKNLFKSAILCKIQSIFEEDHTENDNCFIEEDSARLKKRKRIFGIVKFIGELFLIKVLPEILVQLCATTMLFKTIQADLIQNNGFSNVFENNLEGIIILYDLVGKFIEKNCEKSHNISKNAQLIQKMKDLFSHKLKSQNLATNDVILTYVEIFSFLEFLMKKLDTNKRVQILIQNLLEKRKSNWLDGVFSEEIPKKISELHQEYKQEQTSNAKINPYNKIAINNRVEKKSIFDSFISVETKSTDSGSPISNSNKYFEIGSKISKCFRRYRTKTDKAHYGKEKVYECLKKLLLRTDKKSMVLSQFLENFYNDVAIKAHQLIWIPFRLYEEKYINKKDFIEAFNKSFQVIWQDFGDNPKMLEFISGIFFDFAKNLDCLYEDLNVSQVELDENEEMSDFYGNFLKKSLDLLLNNQKIANMGILKGSLDKLLMKRKEYCST